MSGLADVGFVVAFNNSIRSELNYDMLIDKFIFSITR
jgi:hypothetical protein